MRINAHAARRFLTLYMRLQLFAGQRCGVIPAKMSFDDFIEESLPVKIACRDKIYEPEPLFDHFLLAYDDTLSIEDYNTVADWRRFLRGTFIILRHLKQHTVFIASASPPSAYGVLSLTTDLEDLLPKPRLPISVQTVLLPFEGTIVCDGMLNIHNMVIGLNMRRNLNEEYQEMKSTGRFFRTL